MRMNRHLAESAAGPTFRLEQIKKYKRFDDTTDIRGTHQSRDRTTTVPARAKHDTSRWNGSGGMNRQRKNMRHGKFPEQERIQPL